MEVIGRKIQKRENESKELKMKGRGGKMEMKEKAMVIIRRRLGKKQNR